MILSCSAVSLMRKLSAGQAWIAESLSRHSFVTALSATYINRSLNLGFRGEEFTAGLIHDLGRLILASCMPEQFLQFDPLDFIESSDVLAREQQTFNSDHTIVGSWYLLKNNLPIELIEVVRAHHTPHTARIVPRLVALIALADDMANYLHQSKESKDYPLVDRPASEFFKQHFGETLCARLDPLAPDIMSSAWQDSNQVFAN